jgi:hypothetical protein
MIVHGSLDHRNNKSLNRNLQLKQLFMFFFYLFIFFYTTGAADSSAHRISLGQCGQCGAASATWG